MKTVLVTGVNGQLGMCIKEVAKSYQHIEFIYTNSSQLDITDKNLVSSFFSDKNIDYCINCAAYTAVDKAEENVENAYNINVKGTQHLAEICQENNTILIHISTDFIFDGTSKTPYKETDIPNPKSIYGETKLKGEKQIQLTIDKYYIIRTSWLYSEYGHNFMKTMLRLGEKLPKLGVVNDQQGTPTYAKDLAKIILQFIEATNLDFGIYHYSNEGETTWYGFAKEIFEQSKYTNLELNAVTSVEYKTAAQRPSYSVLNTSKIKKIVNTTIPNWKESLKIALKNYNSAKNYETN